MNNSKINFKDEKKYCTFNALTLNAFSVRYASFTMLSILRPHLTKAVIQHLLPYYTVCSINYVFNTSYFTSAVLTLKMSVSLTFSDLVTNSCCCWRWNWLLLMKTSWKSSKRSLATTAAVSIILSWTGFKPLSRKFPSASCLLVLCLPQKG